MGIELESRCTWPEHFYWGGDGWYDMEEKGCPACFWWTLCYFLALADVMVQPPMSRSDYTPHT